jgi:hypothetical protein
MGLRPSDVDRHPSLPRLALCDREHDLQHPAVVAGPRRCRIHVLAELDPAFECSVFDLDCQIPRPVDLWALSDAGDDQHSVRRDDLDGVRIDPGQLDDHVERRRVVRAEAVALRAKAAPEAGEPRDLPEIREELLDLALEVVDVALASGHVSPVPTLGYGEKRGTSPADRAGRPGSPRLYVVRGRSEPAAGQRAEARARTLSASRLVAASTISPSSALAPSAAARMRLARSTASGNGVKAEFTVAI